MFRVVPSSGLHLRWCQQLGMLLRQSSLKETNRVISTLRIPAQCRLQNNTNPLHSRLRQDHRSPQNKGGLKCMSPVRALNNNKQLTANYLVVIFCAALHLPPLRQFFALKSTPCEFRNSSVCFLRTCHPEWRLVMAVFVIFTHSYHSQK